MHSRTTRCQLFVPRIRLLKSSARAYVRYWHLADIAYCTADVRFQGQSRHQPGASEGTRHNCGVFLPRRSGAYAKRGKTLQAAQNP
jgi:hypothetical protein